MNTTQQPVSLNEAFQLLSENQHRLSRSQQQQIARADDIDHRIQVIEERQEAIEANLSVLRDVEATAALFGWRRDELPLADWLAAELARGRGVIQVWAAAFQDKVAS